MTIEELETALTAIEGAARTPITHRYNAIKAANDALRVVEKLCGWMRDLIEIINEENGTERKVAELEAQIVTERQRTEQAEEAVRFAARTGATSIDLLQEQLAAERAAREKAEAEAERWKRRWQTVTDERAGSFDMFKRILGGVGCTAYQAEIDLEIAGRIGAIKNQLDWIQRAAAPLLPTPPATPWVVIGGGRGVKEIRGSWAEDGNHYAIFVPEPLAPVFIELQQAIAGK